MALLVLIVGVFAALWLYSKESGGQPSSPSAPSPSNAGSVAQWYQNNLDNIGQAIAQWENANPAYNNPGALQNSSGRLSFADIGDGWTALNQWLTAHAAAHPDWSISQFMNYYVNGSTDNTAQNSAGYGNYVADYLGVDPSTPVSYLLGSGNAS